MVELDHLELVLEFEAAREDRQLHRNFAFDAMQCPLQFTGLALPFDLVSQRTQREQCLFLNVLDHSG